MRSGGALFALLQGKPEEKVEPLVTTHSLRENPKRCRILLAEDNLVNQKLASRLLENRQAALCKLEKESFALVLMDVQMPNMGGFEAAAAIREREKTTGLHIPIIAMTAHALKGDEERCITAGMDAYLSKPMRTTELFAQIEKFIGASTKPTASDAVEAPEKLAHLI